MCQEALLTGSETMGVNEGTCQICGTKANSAKGDEHGDWFDCARCGTYRTTLGGGILWKAESPEHMARLSGWVREQNESGVKWPIVTREIVQRTLAMPMPRLRARAERLLRIFQRKFGQLNTWYSPDGVAQDQEVIGTCYVVNLDGIDVLLKLLRADGLLEYHNGLYRLTVAGLLRIEEMSAGGGASAQGFVAMNFADEMNDAWTNGFDPAIRAAGFRPRRIDRKDYVGGIADEIMAEIRASRFVVADYTGHRPGVYFEAGFALGLGLRVIPTCRADEVDDLHFDVKHLNTLLWKSPAELVEGLSRRIRAVIGAGPDFAPSG